MARWSRSRLRIFGIGAVALLSGSLVLVPGVSGAQAVPATAGPATAGPATAPDGIEMIPRANGRSAFQFKPGSGDRRAPYGFVSTGGEVTVQQLGGARPAVRAKTGAPVRAAAPARAAVAAAGTYATTITVKTENWTAYNKLLNLWNRDTWTYVPVDNPPNSLSVKADLPPGNYYVAVIYGIYQVDSYLLTKAFTVTNKAQTVVLDEALAKEVAIKVDDPTAQRDANAVWMSLPNGDLVGFAGGYRQTRTYVTTASTAGTTLRVHEVLTKAGSSALKPSPYRYDLVKSWPHPLPAAPVLAVPTASLATTTTTILAQGITTEGAYLTVPVTGEWTGAYLQTSLRVPATIKEYVTPAVNMSRLVDYGDWQQSLQLSDRNLPAGASAGETVGAGPLVPGRRWYNDDSDRYLNSLRLIENMTLGDAAGNKGADHAATTTMTLSSGGRVLKTANAVSMTVDVPPTQQTYQLEQTNSRKVPWSLLSTKIRSEWTFVSSGPTYGVLPLMDLAMSASGLDQHNRSGAAPVLLTVVPSTRRISAANTVDKVEWSVDDGATWADLPLTASNGGVRVSLDVPATAAFVSLRVTARNDQGGALRRTVLRALAGPATPGDESVGSTTISNLRVNDGKALVFGTSDPAQFIPTFTATFTATDPSGIASAGLYLWHGNYNTPDGLRLTRTDCTPVNATTSNCTTYGYMWDIHYLLASNALAGAWRVEAWASAKDGIGFIDRRAAGTLTIQRATTLTANATPEPAKKGTPITVTGALFRADWESWTFKPYAWRTVSLEWAKAGTSTWGTVKTLKTYTTGSLKPTVTAGSDGSYRFSFAGDAASGPSTSTADYVDVQ